jgi:hypothetical protein
MRRVLAFGRLGIQLGNKRATARYRRNKPNILLKQAWVNSGDNEIQNERSLR